MITLEEGRDTMKVNLQVLVVPYKSIYNYILDIPFSSTLDAMASPFHLKLKYHNDHDEPMKICSDISRP